MPGKAATIARCTAVAVTKSGFRSTTVTTSSVTKAAATSCSTIAPPGTLPTVLTPELSGVLTTRPCATA